jgi:hypothetical protein
MGSIVLSLLFPKKKVTQSLSEQPADHDDIINSSNGSSVSVTSEMEESQTA